MFDQHLNEVEQKIEIIEELEKPKTEDELTNWDYLNGMISQVDYSDEEEEEYTSPESNKEVAEKVQKSVSRVEKYEPIFDDFRTYDNLGFAFSELDLNGQKIESLNGVIDDYKFLKKINLSKNK